MFSGAQHSLMMYPPMEHLPFVGCYVIISWGINSKKQKNFPSWHIQFSGENRQVSRQC